jgi:acetyl-CoA carboxylase carboxyltransferase component
MGMKGHADDFARRRAHAAQMGGDEAVARQHAAGKLTVRERIGRLFDKDTFTEIGIHATHAGIAPDLAGRETPADGVVTGFGKIDGRLASLIAYDFTVMAGSMGRNAETKCNRAREIAYTKRIPMIWLIDSAGARIQEAIGSRWFAPHGTRPRRGFMLTTLGRAQRGQRPPASRGRSASQAAHRTPSAAPRQR